MLDQVVILLCAMMIANIVSLLPYLISGYSAGRKNEQIDIKAELFLYKYCNIRFLHGFTWFEVTQIYLTITAVQLLLLCICLTYIATTELSFVGYLFGGLGLGLGMFRAVIQREISEGFGNNPCQKKTEEANVNLQITKLSLADDELKKFDKKGNLVAAFPLDSIRDVRLEKTIDYVIPSIFIFVFASLAVISKTYISSPGLAWTLTVIFCGLILCSLTAYSDRNIVVSTTAGEVKYSVKDEFELAEGFVAALNQQLIARNT